MLQDLYVVDAFTNQPFAGNPAAVCLLESPADERWMQQVAREMNLSETCFLVPIDEGYALRWFTPATEVRLCGHATLASAFTLWETGVLASDAAARFQTLSGWLTCRRAGNWIEMDFPAQRVSPREAPTGLLPALDVDPLWLGANGMDYLVEVANAAVLRALQPNFSLLATVQARGVIVTCRSDSPDFDFLSRFFAPAAGVNEDPVTGSAHCALGPYWEGKLGRAAFTAFQASPRGGVVKLAVRGDRVLLSGQAVMMSRVSLMQGPTSSP